MSFHVQCECITDCKSLLYLEQNKEDKMSLYNFIQSILDVLGFTDDRSLVILNTCMLICIDFFIRFYLQVNRGINIKMFLECVIIPAIFVDFTLYNRLLPQNTACGSYLFLNYWDSFWQINNKTEVSFFFFWDL